MQGRTRVPPRCPRAPLLLALHTTPHAKPRWQTGCNDGILLIRLDGTLLVVNAQHNRRDDFPVCTSHHVPAFKPESSVLQSTFHESLVWQDGTWVQPNSGSTRKHILEMIHTMSPPFWNYNATEHLKDAENCRREACLGQPLPSDVQKAFLDEYLRPRWATGVRRRPRTGVLPWRSF